MSADVTVELLGVCELQPAYLCWLQHSCNSSGILWEEVYILYGFPAAGAGHLHVQSLERHSLVPLPLPNCSGRMYGAELCSAEVRRRESPALSSPWSHSLGTMWGQLCVAPTVFRYFLCISSVITWGFILATPCVILAHFLGWISLASGMSHVQPCLTFLLCWSSSVRFSLLVCSWGSLHVCV